MRSDWLVKKPGWKWQPSATKDDNSIELRGMAWDLTCPADHRLRAYTHFERFSGPLDVGCPRCKRAYPAAFKST